MCNQRRLSARAEPYSGKVHPTAAATLEQRCGTGSVFENENPKVYDARNNFRLSTPPAHEIASARDGRGAGVYMECAATGRRLRRPASRWLPGAARATWSRSAARPV